jgi:hypothetical protein
MTREPSMTERMRTGIYSDDDLLRDISKELLADVASKHCAAGVDSTMIRQLRLLAENVDYEFAIIGADAHRGPHEDRSYVAAMATSFEIRPIKIVVTSCGRIWTDNTHWTLAALRKYGRSCTVGEVAHYVVQFGECGARLITRPITMDESAARESLRLAGNIQQRLDLGWRPPSISYTIGDLFEDGRYDRSS